MALGASAGVLRGFRTLFGPGAVGGLSDAELVARFARGRDAVAAGAFEAIVARHGPMVLGVCRRVLRDEHDADDAFQATFLVLARKAGRLGRPERLACWLYGVAYRVALKARDVAARRRAREGPLADHDAPAPEAAADDAHDLRPVLDAELARLPGRYRAAIVLHDLEGRSVAETAAALGVAPGTVWSRLNRGRERLRARLARRGLALAAAPAAFFPTRDALAAWPMARLIEPTVLAATGRAAAGASPARAAALARGALRTMTLFRLSTAAAALALVGTGLALYPAEATTPRPAAAPRDDTKDKDKTKDKDSDKEKAAKADAKKLQGTWKAVSATEKGREQPDPEKSRMTFKDDTFTLTRDDKQIAKGTFKVDPSKDPKTIDFEVTEADKDDFKGKTATGIYAFDGKKLKWCSTMPGDGERPTDFTAEDGTTRLSVVFERVEE